ncbi:hypothetical protein [Nonomuraea recticatena]|uniref:Uncharacterized protein n=1 Tax=Nonomuraea recticatena TaxID=46178 RepID=A0ABN3RPA2_9ACTN
MSARIIITCTEHPTLAMCDDDLSFKVETAAAARALYATLHPQAAASKTARVVIGCEVDRCMTLMSIPLDSVAEARAFLSGHNYGWYLARRAGGRLVDGCQLHLGTCCVNCARRPSYTLDPAAVLPSDADHPAANGRAAQLDLFAAGEAA